MIFLALAIACSSSIALIFRFSEAADRNRLAVTSVNYLAACVVGSLLIVAGGIPDGAERGELGRAVAMGAGAGSIFFLGFLFLQIAVREHGVAISGAFAKLGILVPMSLSLVIWDEIPEPIQWGGIALALSSIVIVHWPGAGRKSFGLSLLGLFLFSGTAEFSNKVFQQLGDVALRDVFLLSTFSVALLVSLVATRRSRKPVRTADVLTGIAVGVPNFFSSRFLILALDQISGPVAFAAFGAGTILVIHTVAALLGDRPGRREQIAIVATAVALVLMNLGTS